MSNFYNDATRQRAAKSHYCDFCSAVIAKGEIHWRQTGNYDGAWFSNRFHGECWGTLSEEGSFEFIPGEGTPPDRIIATQESRK